MDINLRPQQYKLMELQYDDGLFIHLVHYLKRPTLTTPKLSHFLYCIVIVWNNEVSSYDYDIPNRIQQVVHGRFNDGALSTIQSGAKEANNLKSVKVVGVEHGTMELTMPGFYLSFTQTFIPE